MVAFNFPTSPSNGDTYDNYVYDATEGVWNANPRQLASRFITSATQPSTPSNGDGWFDTNTGKTYIYYSDGSSAQWVESGNPVIGYVDPYDQTTTSTGYLALPKGTSAQRPVTPNNGDIRFNTELEQPEWYSDSTNEWVLFKDTPTFSVEYVVIAGGGGASAQGADVNNSSGAGGGNNTTRNGGSGVVIFKISSRAIVTFSVGLTEENGGSGQTVGAYKVYTVTAGSDTGTIS